jgi:hypothetical protein
MTQLLPNNGGRRSGIERRNFSYDFHIPERRSHNERRNGKEVNYMSDKEKKVFVKPELIKFDRPLDEITLWGQCGSPPCGTPPGPCGPSKGGLWKWW